MPIASFFRSARRALCLVSALAATVVFPVLAQSPSAADGFNPDVDGVVFTVVTQPDGKLIIGGQFSTVGGVARSNVARLNADGSVDAAFNPSPNGPVRAILLLPDNRLVLGGDFTALQPGATGAVTTRNRIARVQANGALDAAFNPNLGGALQPQVHALALQAGGQIVAGGTFTTAQPAGLAAAVERKYLARFNADGSLDNTFDPAPNGFVLALLPHVDGKLVIGGGFTSLWPAGDTAATTRNRIARLNPNGKIDADFNPDANNGVTTLAVQRDGKILLGGFFTTLQPVGDTAPANRVRFARLNVDGTLDSEFYPRVEGAVASVALQGDGRILVGGSFNSVWGRGSVEASRSHLARFAADGSLDETFAPVINAAVNAVVALPDGRVVIGGNFTRALPRGATTSVVRNRLARLNGDGSLDADFELDAGGRILASVTQTDGKIVVAGTFTNVGGATHNYVARLNADGSVDNSYNPDFNGRVYTLAYDPTSNKVIAGGAFTTIGGEKRERLARLNPDGTIDSEFYPHLDGQVGVVVRQADGKLLIGGSFSSLTPSRATSVTSRFNLLRLNADGTLDTAFDPSPNSSVSAIAVQGDGKILIGGLFTSLAPGQGANIAATPVGRNNFARLNADGTLDTAFTAAVSAQVSAIAVQGDGKILLGGVFTSILPQGATTTTARNRIARLNADGTLDTPFDPNADGSVLAIALQSNNQILIGGTFLLLTPNGAPTPILRKYAARLNADGTVDSAFNLDISELGGNRVDSLRVQADGRILIGGAFTSLQPPNRDRVARRNFARVAADGTVDLTFNASSGGASRAIVNALAVQPDGKVIAAGDFADLGGARSTNIARYRSEGAPDPDFSASLATDGPINAVVVRPNATPVPSQLRGLAWLAANGTLRPGFTTTTVLSGDVSAVALDAQNRLLIGGSFTSTTPGAGGNTFTRTNLLRLNADGSLDLNFDPAPNGRVTSIVVQSDGNVVVGGAFTILGGVTRNRLARIIGATGALDAAYDPNASGLVSAMVLESGDNLIVGGQFTTFTPNAATTAVNRNYLARVNKDGTLDANYNPTMGAPVNALALQAGDNKIIVGGSFNTVQPGGGTLATRNFLARLNADGSLDQNFDPNPNGPVTAIVALPGTGQFYIGGVFTSLQLAGTGAVITRNYAARINSDGAVDDTFNPNPNGPITTLALETGRTVLLAGQFTALQPPTAGAPIARNRLARVDAAGTLDVNFNPDVNGAVNALFPQPDGTVLVAGGFSTLQLNASLYVGGAFATIGGVPARNLAALNDNGSVNATFQPRPDGAVHALLVLPDGRAIVGGAFTNIAGAARSRLARFNSDGTLDASFTAGSTGIVRALALQPDGRVLIGGAAGLVRLNVNGSADATFAAVTGNVTAVAVQADGRILYATSQNALARVMPTGAPDPTFAAASGSVLSLAVQADGRIIVSGTGSRLVRLNTNGSIDASFAPAPNGTVTAVALQDDGRVVAGGSFSSVGGQPRVGIARLAATSPATQQLGVTANRSTIIWNRGGTGGDVAAAIFERSSDQVTWTRLGEGVRTGTAGDWQLGSQNLPASGLFYIRARGLAVSGGGTSSGIFQSVREFNFANPLAAPAATSVQTPLQAAAPTPAIDPITGIAARATVTVVPGEGSVEIFATAALEQTTLSLAQLANISTRGRVTADNPLILGFALAGSESRRVLVRAAGPGLTGFGVAGALGATRLQVFNAAGTVIAANEGWAGAAELTQTAAATGAFPFAPGSADSAAVLTLAPGTYTMHVSDPRGGAGIALAEIYDAGRGPATRLVNLSTRGTAGTGADALISGFVVAGDGAQRVLLRGVGPGLVRFGATGLVADPALTLYDAEGRILGGNDNWVSSINAISQAALVSGAFVLEPGSRDAAVLATLPGGAYTVQVNAAAAGTALLEIYEVR
ncbi:MAG: hypothetical protein JNK23_10160 [Opitutaceae bacterium]|nr:hypothetical protein [Opitutaceae bacterium]